MEFSHLSILHGIRPFRSILPSTRCSLSVNIRSLRSLVWNFLTSVSCTASAHSILVCHLLVVDSLSVNILSLRSHVWNFLASVSCTASARSVLVCHLLVPVSHLKSHQNHTQYQRQHLQHDQHLCPVQHSPQRCMGKPVDQVNSSTSPCALWTASADTSHHQHQYTDIHTEPLSVINTTPTTTSLPHMY